MGGENFDKDRLPSDLLRQLFFDCGAAPGQLDGHYRFTLPVARDCWLWIDVLPAYTRDQVPDEAGRAAAHRVLTARVSGGACGSGQQERLMAAAGRNLRDLFALARQAGDNALYRLVSDGAEQLRVGASALGAAGRSGAAAAAGSSDS